MTSFKGRKLNIDNLTVEKHTNLKGTVTVTADVEFKGNVKFATPIASKAPPKTPPLISDSNLEVVALEDLGIEPKEDHIAIKKPLAVDLIQSDTSTAGVSIPHLRTDVVEAKTAGHGISIRNDHYIMLKPTVESFSSNIWWPHWERSDGRRDMVKSRKIRILKPGVYQIGFNMCFGDTSMEQYNYQCQLLINDEEVAGMVAHGKNHNSMPALHLCTLQTLTPKDIISVKVIADNPDCIDIPVKQYSRLDIIYMCEITHY